MDWLKNKICFSSILKETKDVRIEKVTDDQERCFLLKTRLDRSLPPSSPAFDQLHCERLGLETLAQAGLQTPQIVYHDDLRLVLTWIETQPENEAFWRKAGTDLAQMHRTQRSTFLGFDHDNFIGITLQKNTPRKPYVDIRDWAEFFFEDRLLYQTKLLLEKAQPAQELFERLIAQRSAIINSLCDADEEPSVLHGDLWRGNLLCDFSSTPYFIDPAVYWGHREADIAMTKLFGSFPLAFYEAYQRAFPLKTRWQSREKFYQLYHLLNHWNLFGSTYKNSCYKILNQSDH